MRNILSKIYDAHLDQKEDNKTSNIDKLRMKLRLYLIPVIALSCLFNCFTSNPISAKQSNQSNQKVSSRKYIISAAEEEEEEEEFYYINEPAEKEELKNFVGSFNILQQRYYNQNKSFADNYNQIFSWNINRYLQNTLLLKEINLTFIPVGTRKPGIATVVSMKDKPYSSYIGVVKSVENSTKSIICENIENEIITSADLKKIFSSKLKCPTNFQVVTLSIKEKLWMNSLASALTAEIDEYGNIVNEINQPQKISTLVEADKLVTEGKHLKALQKYQQSLPALGLDYAKLFLLEEEIPLSNSSYLEVFVRDTFLQKLEPVAAALKPEINRDYQEVLQEMSRFIKKHQNPVNNIATKINQITTSELGIALIDNPNQESSISEEESEELNRINEQINILIEDFKTKPEKINAKIPQNLSSYLAKKQTAISKISHLLLTNESSLLDIDMNSLKRGDPSEPLPAFLSTVYLSNIFLIDAIDKYQKGNTQGMLISLEASWIISQSLHKHPILMSQLVSIINYRKQLQVMRQMNNLPSHWQQKLISLNLRESMMDGLNAEVFYWFAVINRDKNFPDTISKDTKMIRRWLTIDNYRTTQEIYNSLNHQKNNACNIDFTEFTNEYLNKKGYTMSAESVYGESLYYHASQLEKAYHLMLEAEMTQKVLQIKDNNHQALNVNLNSKVCPDRNWVYTKLPNNKWSISLNKQPNWKQNSAKEPLIYISNSLE